VVVYNRTVRYDHRISAVRVKHIDVIVQAERELAATRRPRADYDIVGQRGDRNPIGPLRVHDEDPLNCLLRILYEVDLLAVGRPRRKPFIGARRR
jgi:hypothetical protein